MPWGVLLRLALYALLAILKRLDAQKNKPDPLNPKYRPLFEQLRSASFEANLAISDLANRTERTMRREGHE